MSTKICCVCKLDKDKIQDFSVNRANPDGREYICKSCKSSKAKSKRRQKKIYMSAGFGFDIDSQNYYIIKKCEVCSNDFYPIRPSNKRCSTCSHLVRDTQSHLSASRKGNSRIKVLKCSANQAVEIVKMLLSSEKCSYCRSKYTKDNPRSPDHVVPIVNGGTHDINNIKICCLQCNLSKRDTSLGDWVKMCWGVAYNSELFEYAP